MACLFPCGTIADAATVTWNGSTNVSFTDGANWDGGQAPVNDLTTDQALFNATPVTFQPELSGSYSLAGITFSGGTTFSGGGTLQVGTGGVSAAGTNQISVAKIVMGADATFTLANTTTITTEIDTNGRALLLSTNSTNGLNLSNVVISGGGAVTLRAGGFGNSITLGGANTFTGPVSISQANVNFTTLANAGTASSFGAGGGDITVGGLSSTMHLTHTGAGGSTDRLFKAAAGATTTPVVQIANNGTGAIHFNNAGSFGSHTIQFTGTYTGAANTFASQITGAGSLSKLGAAIWALTSTTSSFTGATRINQGTLVVASLANGGQASSIGAANNTVGLLEFNGGTLRYEGATPQSTDRLFTINTNGATIDASGSGGGTLRFTNAGALSSGTGSAARSLVLTGSNGGENLLAGILSNNASPAVVSLVKNGTGRWILTGANTYTGATNLNGGILEINGSQGAATGAIAIADGATLGGTGTTGATVVNGINGGLGTDRISAGRVVSGDVVASVGTLTFVTDVTFNHVTWLVDLVENVNGSADLVSIGGALTLNNVTLDLARFGTFTPSHTYTIAQYASRTGTFNGLSDGAIVSGYQIQYGLTAITLTAVPEPATWLTLVAVGSAVGWRQRRKRKSRISGMEVRQ